MKEKIVQIIYNSIVELNNSQDEKIIVKEGIKTTLYGKNSNLDSLGLVNLVVNIESNIEDEFGTLISLTSEKALSQRNSPFQSIESLAEFIFVQLNQTENG